MAFQLLIFYRSILTKRLATKLRIFIIRHAESKANIQHDIYQKIPDCSIELTDIGHLQANKAGNALKSYLIKNIVSENELPYIRLWQSPYLRTRQTARGIINVLGLKSETDDFLIQDIREADALREQEFGLFEGLTKEECAELYPNENNHYMKSKKFKGEYWTKFPNGESRANVSDRVKGLFSTLIRDTNPSDTRNEGVRNIIVVTHGATARCFTKEYLHLPWEWVNEEKNPNNCSIRLIEDGKDKGYIFDGF